MKNAVFKKLFFVQWSHLEDQNHLQFQTDNLLMVINELEKRFNFKNQIIHQFESGVLLIGDNDYNYFYISTGMEKLIDCQVL